MTTEPDLHPVPDFYALRREGIGHIARTGSAAWTDYNTHDPGITMLEALSYALTELTYISQFPVADLLASAVGPPTAVYADPSRDQPFWSARTILTVNPTTKTDLRRWLIDVERVRNAWVDAKKCGCDAPFFAWCEGGELIVSHDPSDRTDPKAPIVKVEPHGLYDVVLELEPDAEFGDLNDRKVVRRRSFVDPDGQPRSVDIELRFPRWALARAADRSRLAGNDATLAVRVTGPPRRDKAGGKPLDDATLRARWFEPSYVDLEIELVDHTRIPVSGISVRLFGTNATRRAIKVDALVDWLKEIGPAGFVDSYRRKIDRTDQAIRAARAALESHRNLDEDFCRIELVEISDIAVCAEIEVEPDADLELVHALVWFEIERYLDPAPEFHSLAELTNAGVAVEDIFDGPELDNGFLTEAGLRATERRTELRVSDLLNRLVDIDGVIAVDRLLLTAHDSDGNPIAGISDPTIENSAATFVAARTSASWLLVLPQGRSPRAHRGLSSLSYSSQGLPYVPRADEADDVLVQLRGQAARPKLQPHDLDRPIPAGRVRSLTRYVPVQHSLPEFYGIGPAGLPSAATESRRAQAKQLQAYLMVFDQLLRNALAQVTHVGELFSLSTEVDHTYFSALLDDVGIDGYTEIVDSLDSDALAELVEARAEFEQRRNRFLDHLLARFGEHLEDHPMALRGTVGDRMAGDLIATKLQFLKALPRTGHDRGRAFDRSNAPCHPDNVPGLQQRVALLLGLPDLAFSYHCTGTVAAPGYRHEITVTDGDRTVASFVPTIEVDQALEALVLDRGLDQRLPWGLVHRHDGLVETVGVGSAATAEHLALAGAAADLVAAVVAAERMYLANLVLTERARISRVADRWQVSFVDVDDVELGTAGTRFAHRSDAERFAAEIARWSAHARAVVVEHLLLRPKFPGDALYPACSDGDCLAGGCGDEDPYSFRLTYVMPGWTAPFNTDIDLRRFADRTIQEQTPSHLLVKTCWIGNDGYVPDPCDPFIDDIAGFLDASGVDAGSACECAETVLDTYGDAFEKWLEKNPTVSAHPAVLTALLTAELSANVDLTTIPCVAVLDDAQRTQLGAMLIDHFVEIAREGYQFERFETAWCRWVDADAAIDWTAERLQETVSEMLDAGTVGARATPEALCKHAAQILTEVGSDFRTWIETNMALGRESAQFDPWLPAAPSAPSGLVLAPGTLAAIHDVLRHRYAAYIEVSYRLRILVGVVAELSNTYPRATLHDCDDGSDFNPVRLGQTALGSN